MDQEYIEPAGNRLKGEKKVMGRYKEEILWVLVIALIMLTIFNTINIGHNHRMVDMLDEQQEFLGNALLEMARLQSIFAGNQRTILDTIDILIELKGGEKPNGSG